MNLWAARSHELAKETIWTSIFELDTPNNVALIDGCPSGDPPPFYLKNLELSIQAQEEESYDIKGSTQLRNAIAKYHQKHYPKLNPHDNILVACGAQVGMSVAIAAFVDPSDQIIVFEPFYACYSKQSFMHDTQYVGVSIAPKKPQSRQQLKKRIEKGINFGLEDEWTFDPKELEKAFNQKTKMIVVNSPHNPSGKIFNNEELTIIEELLKKYPRVIVVEDNVYETFVYDGFDYGSVHKLSQRESVKDRCLSLYTAGKLLKATGIRVGWILGEKQMIDLVVSAYQRMFSNCCPFLQKCVELSLYDMLDQKNTYMSEQKSRLQQNRDIILQALTESNLDIDVWIPQSSYFLLVDISRVPIKEEFMKGSGGKVVTKDIGFSYQLAHEAGVVMMPGSCYFGDHTKGRDRYVRIAFCKEKQLLLETKKRLNKYSGQQ